MQQEYDYVNEFFFMLPIGQNIQSIFFRLMINELYILRVRETYMWSSMIKTIM